MLEEASGMHISSPSTEETQGESIGGAIVEEELRMEEKSLLPTTTAETATTTRMTSSSPVAAVTATVVTMTTSAVSSIDLVKAEEVGAGMKAMTASVISDTIAQPKKRKRVMFAEGTTVEDGDSATRLHKQARQLAIQQIALLEGPPPAPEGPPPPTGRGCRSRGKVVSYTEPAEMKSL